jgi:hypothetical protein
MWVNGAYKSIADKPVERHPSQQASSFRISGETKKRGHYKNDIE